MSTPDPLRSLTLQGVRDNERSFVVAELFRQQADLRLSSQLGCADTVRLDLAIAFRRALLPIWFLYFSTRLISEIYPGTLKRVTMSQDERSYFTCGDEQETIDFLSANMATFSSWTDYPDSGNEHATPALPNFQSQFLVQLRRRCSRYRGWSDISIIYGDECPLLVWRPYPRLLATVVVIVPQKHDYERSAAAEQAVLTIIFRRKTSRQGLSQGA